MTKVNYLTKQFVCLSKPLPPPYSVLLFRRAFSPGRSSCCVGIPDMLLVYCFLFPSSFFLPSFFSFLDLDYLGLPDLPPCVTGIRSDLPKCMSQFAGFPDAGWLLLVVVCSVIVRVFGVPTVR